MRILLVIIQLYTNIVSWVFMGFHGVHKPFYPNKKTNTFPKSARPTRDPASPPIPQGSGWSMKIFAASVLL